MRREAIAAGAASARGAQQGDDEHDRLPDSVWQEALAAGAASARGPRSARGARGAEGSGLALSSMPPVPPGRTSSGCGGSCSTATGCGPSGAEVECVEQSV